MSDKFHFNPNTGKVGRCSASVRDCAFADDNGVPEHYDSEDAARSAYEKSQEANTFSTVSKDRNNNNSAGASPSDPFGFIDDNNTADAKIVEEVTDVIIIDEDELVPVDREIEKYVPSMSDKKSEAIVKKSQEFVANIANADDASKKEMLVGSISAIGDQAFKNSAMQALSQIEEGKLGNEMAGSSDVGKDLVSLRSVLQEIQPTADDFIAKKVLGFIPMGSALTRWSRKFESNEKNLKSILKSLDSGGTELEVHNNKLRLKMDGIKQDMTTLRDSQILLNQLDIDLQKQIGELKQSGDLEKAKELETTALFKVRQRRADVAQQAVVSLQAFAVSKMIVSNNELLQDNIERTKSTTVAALVTAVQTQQALGYQKKVAEGINSMNSLTNDLILKNSEQLGENSRMINEQAMSTAIDPKVLEQSFQNIFRTLDESDAARQKANDRLLEVTNALENVVQNARTHSQMRPAIDGNSDRAQLGQ